MIMLKTLIFKIDEVQNKSKVSLLGSLFKTLERSQKMINPCVFGIPWFLKVRLLDVYDFFHK